MALKDKMSVGRKGEVVMSNATGGQEIPTPDVKTMKDHRSEILTNQDAVYNKIAVGEEVEVRGTRRMLKSKSKKATWY